eukprot:g891.t1
MPNLNAENRPPDDKHDHPLPNSYEIVRRATIAAAQLHGGAEGGELGGLLRTHRARISDYLDEVETIRAYSTSRSSRQVLNAGGLVLNCCSGWCAEDVLALTNAPFEVNIARLTAGSMDNKQLAAIVAAGLLARTSGLFLLFCNITDIAPVRGLLWLERISLGPSNLLVDISPLSTCPRLREVELHALAISDLSPLSSLHALSSLSVFKCNGVMPTPRLGSGRRSPVPGSGVTSIEPLASLQSLTKLDLSCCEDISDLRPLAKLTCLEQLDLSQCQGVTAASLCPLASLKKLELLNLAGIESRHQQASNSEGESEGEWAESIATAFAGRDGLRLLGCERAAERNCQWLRQVLPGVCFGGAAPGSQFAVS